MDIFAEYEAALLRDANTPERIAEDAALADRRWQAAQERHALGVRMGWHDEEGNSLLPDSDDEEDDSDEELADA